MYVRSIEQFSVSEAPVQNVNRHTPEILEGLSSAPVYRKQGQVSAEIAKGGEEVVTTLADGTTETHNTAQPGDAIITNPGGEKYIINKAKFTERYDSKEGEDGVYIANGHCKAMDNPYGSPITMMASWGEMQNGDADCKLADTYEPATGEMGGEPYIIGRSEFDATYKIVE
ncbi:hypothetical protein COT50_01050 [candidate division WWE3 bacterium CG08_land_8_20_14_0_20_41_10]|uniref:Uncharacterized protein n=1 Tax=candidate division WWE3 bacterium CG08_land_8_20_14_0_20_41_10 TaxID=1975085 RepID=A0A2H0XCE5_UNCKA|nr:MAG: hypothetical protein COT50_01050 [candidate division WWE3 bacterium CG08_land_8_20_14_0_20_41_10]